MRRFLIFLGLVGLLLLYVWERSLAFQLNQAVKELEAEDRRRSEELLQVEAELDRLISYSRLWVAQSKAEL